MIGWLLFFSVWCVAVGGLTVFSSPLLSELAPTQRRQREGAEGGRYSGRAEDNFVLLFHKAHGRVSTNPRTLAVFPTWRENVVQKACVL